MPNLLSLDVGEKRIGVAIADVSAPFPAPLITLEASEHLATEFAAILKKYSVQAVVIGMPRNQAGERTAQSERVEHIARLLAVPSSLAVYWQDESLTSVKAEEELKKRKKPYAKAAVDSLAATYILEDFVRANPQISLSSAPDVQNIQPTEPKIKNNKPFKNRSFKKTVALAVGSLFGLSVLAITAFTLWYFNALSPRTSKDVYSVVSVKPGSGTKTIAAELEAKQVIKSATAFSLYARLHKINNLQAGEYRLSSKQSVKTIVSTIAGGKVTTVNVLISPGQTLDQIMASLEKDGYSEAELQKAMESVRDHPLLTNEAKTAKLEGYLFPDTYQIGPSTTAEQLIRLMLDNFQKKITPEIEAGIAAQGLTFHQAVTLASVVQKEVGDPKVQPTVAQVFIKRYKQGTMLGSDVTSLYGAQNDDISLPSNSAQAAAIAIAHSSPYNTRRVVGLPPTAISNFNLSALAAVANPTKTEYLFFVAGDNGNTYFSKTVEEHEALVKKYCITLCG